MSQISCGNAPDRAQLQPLHRMIALALETRPDVSRSIESLAYHWWAAGDLERAARYNEEAGDAAAALHAHDDALAFYRRAQAAANADAPSRARSRVHLGVAWLAASFYHPTLAVRHLADVDPRAFDDAPDVAVRYYNVRAWVAMLLGDAERFRADHAAWVRAAREAGGVGMLAAAHYNGAFCYALFGLRDEARSCIHAALDIASEEQSRHVAASARGMAAFCAILRGDLAGARDALSALRALPTDNEVIRAHAMAWGTLAGSYLDDAPLVDEWFDRLGGVVAPFFAAICGAGCAEVLMRRGRLDDAHDVLRNGIGTGERQRGNVLTLLAVARIGAQADVLAARQVLALAADSVSEVVERHALALFDAFTAQRAGGVEDARKNAASAAPGFRRLRFPLLEATALELAGETAAALAAFAQCGAVHDVRRLTRAQGRPVSPDAELTAPPNGLSSRENEIAALVARGRSNVEIGRALAVSHKTVEKHLSGIFKKLNFSSRAQLAAHVSASRPDPHGTPD